MKVRKTQEGGLNCVFFFFLKLSPMFKSDKVQSLEQRNMQRIMKRDREKRKTQNNYIGSFHNPEVVQSSPPCTSKENSLKSISDYKCSSTKARDFKLLKHKSKRFHMLKHKRKRLPMLKHNCKRLLTNTNYKEICLRLNT